MLNQLFMLALVATASQGEGLKPKHLKAEKTAYESGFEKLSALER